MKYSFQRERRERSEREELRLAAEDSPMARVAGGQFTISKAVGFCLFVVACCLKDLFLLIGSLGGRSHTSPPPVCCLRTSVLTKHSEHKCVCDEGRHIETHPNKLFKFIHCDPISLMRESR